MKAHYKTQSGRITIELESETVKGLFAAIGAVSEVFDSDQFCGCCESPRIVFRTRTVEGNTFYELYCTEADCGAFLEFGQHRTGGTLFPKRKNEHGLKLASRGWTRYQAEPESSRAKAS